MKIAVFTYSDTDDNYGQVLQCYALQQYLISLGHDATLARYHSAGDGESFALVKNVVRSILRLVSPQRRAKHRAIKKIMCLRQNNRKKNKARKFSEFKARYIQKCADYKTYREVLKNPPNADAYIVGSDQVWNVPSNDPAARVWFLEFGKNSTRRISYAASIGRRLRQCEIESFGKRLKKFSAVSVRETSAYEDCRRAGRSDAKIVLDPTLLAGVDLYRLFMQALQPKRAYLFCYYLNIGSADALCWPQIECYLKDKGLELVSVNASGYLPAVDLIPGHECRLLTIQEWISGICHAAAVVTTSFHGVAFSVLMHRPFVVILLKGAYSSGNDRIVSLLESLGIEDRILGTGVTISEILDREINWAAVDERLDALREVSGGFLKKALA